MFQNLASEFVYIRTYSRWLDDKNRRETWEETVDRYVNFITEERGSLIPSKVISKIREKILNFEVMPSMRALWAAGPAAKNSNVCMYNCSAVLVDSVDSFAEALYILCCFHPDTEIITKQGKKRISEITLNDAVLSFNEEFQKYEYINPSHIHENDTNEKEKIELEFDDGSKIVCTSDHLFLTKRGWIEAKDLTEEDVFIK